MTADSMDAMLQALRPHLRKVVEVADSTLLAAFDASYDDATADASEGILEGPFSVDELSGEQALGLRGHASASVLAFVINVAASIAVARFQSDHPAAWAWLTDGGPSGAAATHRSRAAVRLVERSELPDGDRAKVVACFQADETLNQLLEQTYPQ